MSDHVGASLAILATTWPDLGTLLSHGKLPLRPLWRIFDHLGAMLAPSWLQLGHLCPILALSWVMLRSLWAHLEAILGAYVGPCWRIFGHLGAMLAASQPDLGTRAGQVKLPFG